MLLRDFIEALQSKLPQYGNCPVVINKNIDIINISLVAPGSPSNPDIEVKKVPCISINTKILYDDIMNRPITKDDIMRGFETGAVKIINNPNDNCIAAQIGEYWFYFAGNDDDYMVAEAYVEYVGIENIAGMIVNVLTTEPIRGKTFEDSSEWLYYRAVLDENNNTK